MDARGRRIGILAGGGDLPREIAESAQRRGLPVAIVAIDGEADADFTAFPTTRVNWGQIGTMIRTLKRERVTDLVIVGRVSRPELKILRPDLGFLRHLPHIIKIVASGGDDGVLRRVVRFFEDQGLHVIGPDEAAPELVVREGPLGRAGASPSDRADAAQGLALIRALGPYDIGQSVVVSAGAIEAIEGVEGTDRMIARAAALRSAAAGAKPRGGVLVKRSKPGQDLRVDMPAIGPATVEGIRAAGLNGIVVEAGSVIVAARAATLKAADTAGVFVEGLRDGEAAAAPRRFNPRLVEMPFATLGKEAPAEHARLDAVKAVATLDALRPFRCGRAVIVVRNHVLAVEAGEGVDATLERAAGLRQWKSITHHRRGVIALRDPADLTATVIRRAAGGSYAGVVVSKAPPAGSETEALAARTAEAEAEGLFVAVRDAKPGRAP
jgi:DUF1009 family protein